MFLSARISAEPHARSLPIFVHVAYDRGSVLSGQCDEIPSERGSFGVFFPTDNALYIVQHCIWDPYKTAERIEMPFGTMMGLARRTVCYVGLAFPDG